jgi:chorismate mutase
MTDSPHTALSLNNIRNTLIRLEETIIFSVIERSQFCQNLIVYQKDGLGDGLHNQSLLDFMLHECERSHALVRRYTSPDEYPFFDDLPEPFLPDRPDTEHPLHPNTVNINKDLYQIYQQDMVPFICPPGDDDQYGSTAVNDVALLQTLSKRIHYGKFVAESKYQQQPEQFDPLIAAQDRAALMKAITNAEVEANVLRRVLRKAQTYAREFQGTPGDFKVDPQQVHDLYLRWIIPMNKEVQVEYLCQRV